MSKWTDIRDRIAANVPLIVRTYPYAFATIVVAAVILGVILLALLH